jgi:septal ring factor EnvC (AmiA/AmiB activator)
MLTVHPYAIVEGSSPQALIDLVQEAINKLRHSVRVPGEVEEHNREVTDLRDTLETQRNRLDEAERTISCLREDLRRFRDDNARLTREKAMQTERIVDLLRAKAPGLALGESEKQAVRDGNAIAAIKLLRERTFTEYGYTPGLMECKLLVDAYRDSIAKELQQEVAQANCTLEGPHTEGCITPEHVGGLYDPYESHGPSPYPEDVTYEGSSSHDDDDDLRF